MRLFPNFMRQRCLGWRLIPREMQPAMPIGRHAACLGFAIVDHPATFGVACLVIDIALRVLADFHTLAGGEDLRAKGLAVPPGHQALEEIHEGLRDRLL